MCRAIPLVLASLLAPYGLTAATSTAPGVREAGGIIVVQVEAAPAIGGWESRTAIADHSGKAYYHNRSANANVPGNDILEYPILIAGAGTYQVQVRHRIDEGASNTDANDSFLRLVDSAGKQLEPVPNQNVVTGAGWYKFYMNTLNAWTWQVSNKDHDPKSLAYVLAAKQIYKVQISRRSKGHAVDSIVLWDRGRHALGNVATGQASKTQSTALDVLSAKGNP